MIQLTKTKVVGIIAEYNPFHNGHLYHLQKARQEADAVFSVVVMSGNFVQRGMPSIFDKYLRTAMALEAGADLVLELPCAFATGSAEDFASAGVALLNKLGVVDTLCFGSECGDTARILHTASILADETPAYQQALKAALKKGMTFPAARTQALCPMSGGDTFLSSPNNILGIEYCKALIRQGSHIQPVAVQREGSGYHEEKIGTGYCSASAIRQELYHGATAAGTRKNSHSIIKQQVPGFVYPLIEKGHAVCNDDFSVLLHGSLLRLDLEQTPFSSFADVSEELASRIADTLFTFSPFEEKIKQLKTKQYTYTRISRALLHILLGITKDQMEAYRSAGYAPYARVLGFRKASSILLSEIKKRGDLPLLTKTADAAGLLTGTAKNMFLQDLACSHLYQSAADSKYRIQQKNEYTRSVVIR